MPIHAVPHHVAAAVPSIDAAHARWRDRLGGGDLAGDGPFLGFRNHQYRFGNDAVLELLEPGDDDGTFVRDFLDRFGPRIHHVTLKVDDLPAALEVLAAEDLPVVDVSLDDERWQESFVRPSAVGGLVVQVAATTLDDDGWAALSGFTMTDPRPDAAHLLGPLLAHPDLDRARAVWTSLGGTATDVGSDEVEVAWPGSPLTVRVRRGAPAGPIGLRFADAGALPDDPALGPAVLPG